MAENFRNPEGVPFPKGSGVMIKAEEFSQETLVGGVLDKLNASFGPDSIEKMYKVFYLSGNIVYIGPAETPLSEIMAFEPGANVSTGPVIPIHKKFLQLFGTS